jgi:hypothetical protein
MGTYKISYTSFSFVGVRQKALFLTTDRFVILSTCFGKINHTLFLIFSSPKRSIFFFYKSLFIPSDISFFTGWANI